MRFNTDRLRLEARRARKPIVYYLLGGALASVAAWVLFHNLTGELPWKDYSKVRIEVTDAKGLVAGQQEVRAAGVRVGVVSGVQLKNGHAIATLSIDKDYGPVYRDARMRLRAVTPLQDLYVAIERRGTPAAGRLGPGAVLDTRRTDVPVDISRVLDTFDPSTRTRLNELLDQMGKALPDRGQRLEEAFAQVAPFLKVAGDVGDAMADRRRHLAGAVHAFNQLTTALARRDKDLAGTVRTANTTLAALSDHRGALDGTLRELAPTMDSLQRTFVRVEAMEGDLDPALTSLAPVAANLSAGLSSLRTFAKDAQPALAALRTPVQALRPMARAARPTAHSAGQAITELQPQAPDLDAITKDVVPCLPHIGKFFWRTISLTKIGDTNGFTPRADVAVSLTTPDFLKQKDTLTLDKLLPCYKGKVAP